MDFKVIVGSSDGSSITVDDAMSTTSTNPVQNSVISAALQEISGNVIVVDEDDSDTQYSVSTKVSDGRLVTTYTAL